MKNVILEIKTVTTQEKIITKIVTILETKKIIITIEIVSKIKEMMNQNHFFFYSILSLG